MSKSSLSLFIPCIMRAIVLLLVIPCAAIHSMGRPAQNAAALVAAMAELDSDGSGEVDYTEFVGWWQRQDSESQRLIEQQQGNGPAVEFKARRSKARPSLKSVGQGVVASNRFRQALQANGGGAAASGGGNGGDNSNQRENRDDHGAAAGGGGDAAFAASSDSEPPSPVRSSAAQSTVESSASINAPQLELRLRAVETAVGGLSEQLQKISSQLQEMIKPTQTSPLQGRPPKLLPPRTPYRRLPHLPRSVP